MNIASWKYATVLFHCWIFSVKLLSDFAACLVQLGCELTGNSLGFWQQCTRQTEQRTLLLQLTLANIMLLNIKYIGIYKKFRYFQYIYLIKTLAMFDLYNFVRGKTILQLTLLLALLQYSRSVSWIQRRIDIIGIFLYYFTYRTYLSYHRAAS